MTLRIATTQPEGSVDVRDNGRIARALTPSADGVRLIQFPEGFLSGYAKAQIKDWADVDWEAVRAELGTIAALAAELNLWMTVVTLDRRAGEFHVALDLARPWRAAANQGDIYRRRRVDDPRSADRTAI